MEKNGSKTREATSITNDEYLVDLGKCLNIVFYWEYLLAAASMHLRTNHLKVDEIRYEETPAACQAHCAAQFLVQHLGGLCEPCLTQQEGNSFFGRPACLPFFSATLCKINHLPSIFLE